MKKLVQVVVAAGLISAALLSSLPVSAANDNANYTFRVHGLKQNTQAGGRYRQTTNYKNNWKVNLVNSSEGPHTKTTFWLEKGGGGNVSPSVTKTAGNGPSYRRVNSDFNGKQTVMLTAQNNNFNTEEYNISGYWDEETGIVQ